MQLQVVLNGLLMLLHSDLVVLDGLLAVSCNNTLDAAAILPRRVPFCFNRLW